ncbi:HET domain containing protein [Pyrenophora tritici-repentis]|nr:HET domain containing protein [Pyrenophora tritici-repentis]
MANTTKITYDEVPLSFGSSTNFRLLTIEPCSDPNDEVYCNLHVRAMEEPPQYIALSYTWGEPSPTRMIMLNGRPFRVRQNLWDFLVQARSHNLTTMLWVDALCIDQSQVKERNHQVSMMGRIYSGANYVIVWLGRVTPTLEKSWQLMNTTYLYFIKIAIRDICERKYWTRVWAIQEFTLAKCVMIWCGSQAMDEEVLKWLLETAYYSENPHEDCSWSDPDRRRDEEILSKAVMRFLNYVKRHTASKRSSRKGNMGGVLIAFGPSMECSDSRDGLYALLSLIDPEETEALGLIPDYNKSTIEIFHDTWEAMMSMHIYYGYTGDLHDTRELVNGLAAALRLDIWSDEV